MDHIPRVAFVAVILMSAVTSLGGASPHQQSDENGLNATERATLWSRDVDSNLTNTSVDEPSSADALHQLASATDITFDRPPATAGIWTRNDATDFEAGNTSTSAAPPHAKRQDSWAIKDAHATVFGHYPATYTHVNATTVRRYVAPDGTVHGAVDYRIAPPENVSAPNRTETWTIQEHEIDEVRLLGDGRVLAQADGSHTPRLRYQLRERGQVTLELVAEISVTIQHTVTVRRPGMNRTGNTTNVTRTTVTTETDSVTVRDALPVTVYDPTVAVQHTEYPSGDTGVGVARSQPVSRYTFDSEQSTAIHTRWRFYTARNASWDRVVHHTEDGRFVTASPARPVTVHAYPTTGGPRIYPLDTRATISHANGPRRSPPTSTIGPNVTVDVVESSYQPSALLAVRGPNLGHAVDARSLVNGVRVDVREESTERSVHESRLSAEVLRRDAEGAVLVLELRDSAAEEPIQLTGNDTTSDTVFGKRIPSDGGYITVAGQRVETNRSGLATVRISQPGVYTARFHPNSWVTSDPAYTTATATARWHPLTRIEGWMSFAVSVLLGLLPFGIALYIGRRLGTFLDWNTDRRGRF